MPDSSFLRKQESMQRELPLSAVSSVTGNCNFPLFLALPHKGGGDERSRIGLSLPRLVKGKESGKSDKLIWRPFLRPSPLRRLKGLPVELGLRACLRVSKQTPQAPEPLPLRPFDKLKVLPLRPPSSSLSLSKRTGSRRSSRPLDLSTLRQAQGPQAQGPSPLSPLKFVELAMC